MDKHLLPPPPPIQPYSIVDHSLRRLGESPTRKPPPPHDPNNPQHASSPSPPPSWTQSPSTRALRNIGAGTTDILFGSKGSIQSCIMTLASCTIGTGVLALPAAFAEAGFAAGLALITLSVGFNAWTCLLLTHCCVLSKQYSYRRIGEAAFGRTGGLVVKVGLVAVLFGIITALQVVLSDSLYKVAHLFVDHPASKWTLSGVAIGVTVLPLSLPSDISALRYTSVLALTSMLYVTIVVVVCGYLRVEQVGGLAQAIDVAINETNAFWEPQSGSNTLNASASKMLNIMTNVPVFMMAFGCQVQVPDIFRTMPKKTIAAVVNGVRGGVRGVGGQTRTRSLKDMQWVVAGALFIVCFLYLLLGVSGAMAFVGHWNQLKGDVLIALGTTTSNHMLLNNIGAARVVMCVSVSLTCPLLVLPCRDTALQLLGLDWHRGNHGEAGDDRNRDQEEADEADTMEKNRRAHRAGTSKLNPSASNVLQHRGAAARGAREVGGRKNKWPATRMVSHSLVTAGLLVLTWVLANSINNLKLVLGFTGATGGCLLLYILPSLFYLKLLRLQQRRVPNGKGPSCAALLFGWVPLVLGTVIMVVSTGSTIYFVSDGTTSTNATMVH